MEKLKNKPPVWLIVVLIGFPQLSETIFSPILPSLESYFLTTKALCQSTLSIYFLGFGFGVFFWGNLADRIGRKPCLMLGLLLFTFASLCMFFASSIEAVLAVRVFQAFGASVGSIITQTLIRDSFAERTERLKVFATISAALSFAPALGPLIASVIMESLSFQMVFIFLSIMGLIIFLLSLRNIKETLDKSYKSQKNIIVLKRALKDFKLWQNSFLVASLNTIIFLIYSEGPFVFIKELGLDPQHYACFGVSIAMLSLVGASISRKLGSLRWSSDSIILTGITISLIASMVYALSSLIEFDNQSHLLLWLLISIGLIFVGIVIALPCILSESLVTYKDCLGRAGAFFSLCYYLELSCLLEAIHFMQGETIYNISFYTFLLCMLMIALKSRTFIEAKANEFLNHRNMA